MAPEFLPKFCKREECQCLNRYEILQMWMARPEGADRADAVIGGADLWIEFLLLLTLLHVLVVSQRN